MCPQADPIDVIKPDSDLDYLIRPGTEMLMQMWVHYLCEVCVACLRPNSRQKLKKAKGNNEKMEEAEKMRNSRREEHPVLEPGLNPRRQFQIEDIWGRHLTSVSLFYL